MCAEWAAKSSRGWQGQKVPENKILKAPESQKARTPLLAIPKRNRAAGVPPEVVDYTHSNAHSVFFLDAAGTSSSTSADTISRAATLAPSDGPTFST